MDEAATQDIRIVELWRTVARGTPAGGSPHAAVLARDARGGAHRRHPVFSDQRAGNDAFNFVTSSVNVPLLAW